MPVERNPRLFWPVNVRDLGAAPAHSAAVNTAAIQAAVDRASAAGGGVVVVPDGTYDVTQAATKAYASASGGSLGYCISLPSNVTLHLESGATLKLAAGQDAIVVTNASANATTDVNIGLTGFGTIHGRDLLLTGKGVVQFEGVTGLNLDVKVVNAGHVGIWVLNCTGVTAPRLYCDTVAGIGVYLGSPTYPVYDSNIGVVDGRNLTADTNNVVNFPGNPFYGNLVRSHIDSINTKTCTGGVKLDRVTDGLTIGSVVSNTTTGLNTGLKFQGDGTGPTRVTVDQVMMRAQESQGLYMEQCIDCSVGTYTGEGNGTGGTTPDVWVGGTRDTIGACHIRNAGAQGLEVRSTAVEFDVGTLKIVDANRNQVASKSGVQCGAGLGRIGQCDISDSTGYMSRGIDVNSSTARLTVGQLKVSGTWLNAPYTFAASSPCFARNVVGGNPTYAEIAVRATGLATIASAGTITLPVSSGGSDVFIVSGTTTITSVTASWAERRVTLIFSGVLTFTDGSNLKLVSNMTTSADDTITLVSDGTNWYEVARAAN